MSWSRVHKTFYGLIIIFIIYIPVLNGQHPLINKYRFEKDYRLDREIKNKEVKAILQDDSGILWLATTGGLIKYDGMDTFLYKEELIDSTGASRDYLLCLEKGANGILWMGTYGQGLIRFDTWNNTFTFYTHDPGNPGSLSDNNVFDLHVDHKGSLWVATYGGLNRYEQNSDSFITYSNDPTDSMSLSNNDVFRLTEDSEGNIWLATYGGLNQLDVEQNTFLRYAHQPDNENSLLGNNLVSIYADEAGKIWTGSYQKGLNKLDPITGVFNRFLPGYTVFCIYPNSQNQLWLGTDKGLLLFNKENNEVLNAFLPDTEDPLSIRSNIIHNLYQDNAGTLWVGTWSQGINKMNLNNNRTISYYPVKKAASNTIRTFYNDETIIWGGTGSGLVKINKIDKSYEINDIGISVNAIQKDETGRLWISNYSGLYSYDPDTDRVIEYPELKHVEGLSVMIRDIYLHGPDKLYIGSWDGGLSCYNIKKGTIALIPHPELNNGDLDINTMYADSQGLLWIGTQGEGLLAFDLYDQVFIPDVSSILKNINDSGIVNYIYEDKNGVLWIATREGLVKYRKGQGVERTYTPKEGFPSLTIYNIMEDDEGNIWFTSQDGVIKFDQEEEYFLNCPSYDFQDYNPSISAIKDENGNFYFGGQAGFNVMHPDSLFRNEYDPDVVLTKLTIANNPVNPYNYLNPSPIFDHSITLPYDQNVISFEFAAMDFRDPAEIIYNYMLENFDDDWISADASHRTATYTNLPPGQYVFKVKSTNSHGYWNDKLKQIELIITPPFWMTWWFRGFAAVTFIGLIFGFYRWRTHSIRNQNKRLEELVALRTHELDTLNQERIEFLNIFTHDIVDPLVSLELLANRLQENVYNFSAEEIDKACKRIEFNTSRISSLTNNILKAGLLESDRLKLTPREFDVVKITQHVIQEYQIKALEKDISITFKSNKDVTSMHADRSAYVQVIGNLLSNAIKYSEPNSEVNVSLEIHKNDGVIKVKDHGLGFTEEDKKEVFQKFKKLSATPTANEPSSGLGLFIVKMLVDKMGGSIAFESTYGEGTEFSICLNLGLVKDKADYSQGSVVHKIS